MSEPEGPVVYFGGPDKSPRALRHLLHDRVEAVPAGGEILWATYYFRDQALARALVAASDRGVRVVLHVEGRPRRRSANRPVLQMLEEHGLGGGLHVHAPTPGLAKLHPHLHAKIYAFSHPRPSVLVGSFNPSGDMPEDLEVIAEIGDQDRGHNLLVQFDDPVLVDALRGHVLNLGGVGRRFSLAGNRRTRSAGTSLYVYPRLSTGVIDRRLAGLGRGARVRGAISHLKGGALAQGLSKAAKRGASVQLILHDTERRAPEAAVAALAAAGVRTDRYRHPEGLPLHAKLLLIDAPGSPRTAYFGSYNYNPRSRWLNHELLVESRDPRLVEPLSARFDQIAEEVSAMSVKED
jgi:hypothetical protein